MSKLLNNKAWKEICWQGVDERIYRIQSRIYKARKSGNIQKTHWLQNKLIHSADAKLSAVRLVTTLNRGKNTAGIDGARKLNDKEKMILARNLSLNGKAQPIRRVWIPKPGKTEKRPLGIPTVQDRAKQALAKLALEPEWEAIFEPNSYGFRPGRSTHDAIEAIFSCLHHGRPKLIYDADIRKCFDRINHDALINKLKTFPLMKNQIQAWLKAGVMESFAKRNKEQTTPTEMGTPQGGVISPLLANIAMHGLEEHLKDFVSNLKINPRPNAFGKEKKRQALGVIRYADDFVIIHENKEIMPLCIAEAKNWLIKMGLEISEEKSSIRDSRQGIKFLGFKITLVRKAKRYKVKIVPSKDNTKRFLEKIKNVIQKSKSCSAYQLIERLRPITLGWANYFRYCECGEVFNKLNDKIFRKLRAWVFRRDTRNGRRFVKEKYFPSNKTYTYDGRKHQNNWILNGKQKDKGGQIKENILPSISWVKSCKHVKILGSRSPFDGDNVYWAIRNLKYSNLPVRVKRLLKSQKGKCTICKKKFTVLDKMEVDHITPTFKGGKDRYDNLQLLHVQCHVNKTAADLKT
uniref:Putative reverse transcriptase n=1 Tax=Chlamydomonas nivalis TaxID=47906 RepID=A0A0S2IBK1_9CHLO|nr:putative reverse transcriptase [Chlamydomonas nivalis]